MIINNTSTIPAIMSSVITFRMTEPQNRGDLGVIFKPFGGVSFEKAICDFFNFSFGACNIVWMSKEPWTRCQKPGNAFAMA